MGLSTEFICYKTSLPEQLKWLKLPASISYLAREIIADTSLKKYNEEIIAEATNFNPDLILIFKGEGIGEQTLKSISNSIGIKIALWSPDDPQFFKSRALRIPRNVDYAFTYASNAISMYKEEGIGNVFRLVFELDYEIHRKLETNKIYGITFIGTLGKRRSSIVRSLKKNRINVHVFGRGEFGIPVEFMYRPVYLDEYVRVLNQSCLTLNINQNTYCGQNMRTFKATASGIQLLTDCADDIKEFFTEEEVTYCIDLRSLTDILKEFFHYGEKPHQTVDKDYIKHRYDHTYSVSMRAILVKRSCLMNKTRRARGIRCTT